MKHNTIISRMYSFCNIRNQHGFTLVEVMTVVVIIALLALFAAPEVISWRPRMNLKAASEDLYSNMQLAKMHALKNNVDVYLAFKKDTGCVGNGGEYVFGEVVSGVDVASGTMADGVCLSGSTFPAPSTIPVPAAERVNLEGFTSRGLPIKSAGGNVTLQHSKVTRQYVIEQSVAGGVKID